MSTLSKYGRKWGREIARYPEKWGRETKKFFEGDSKAVAEAMRRANEENRKAIGELQVPDIQFRRREVPNTAEYKPRIYERVTETGPKTIEDTAAGRAGLAAQQEALARYQGIANSESDPRLEALINRANRRAQGEAQGRQGAITEAFARRGQLGSGLELAAQLGSAAQANELAASQSQDAAAEAYRNRLEAIAKSGQLGREIRSDEAAREERNVNIINDFNRRLASEENAYRRYGAETENEAQRYRNQEAIRKYALEVEQDVAENGIKSQKFQDALQIVALKTGQNAQEIQNRIAMARDAASQRMAILQVLGTAGMVIFGGPAAIAAPAAAAAASSYTPSSMAGANYNLGLTPFGNVTGRGQ